MWFSMRYSLATGTFVKIRFLNERIFSSFLSCDPRLRYREHVVEFGNREFAKAQRTHEEGVVAKRATGFYYSGKRTREWLKFKAVHEQEVVVVGYTEPRKSRKYFGSLVLAVRDKTKKRWVYAGHVGTGFDQAALKSLYGTMQPLRTDKKPFDQKVKSENATTWLIPKLVGEVKFTGRVDPRCATRSSSGSAPTRRPPTSAANKHENSAGASEERSLAMTNSIWSASQMPKLPCTIRLSRNLRKDVSRPIGCGSSSRSLRAWAVAPRLSITPSGT